MSYPGTNTARRAGSEGDQLTLQPKQPQGIGEPQGPRSEALGRRGQARGPRVHARGDVDILAQSQDLRGLPPQRRGDR